MEDARQQYECNLSYIFDYETFFVLYDNLQMLAEDDIQRGEIGDTFSSFMNLTVQHYNRKKAAEARHMPVFYYYDKNFADERKERH